MKLKYIYGVFPILILCELVLLGMSYLEFGVISAFELLIIFSLDLMLVLKSKIIREGLNIDSALKNSKIVSGIFIMIILLFVIVTNIPIYDMLLTIGIATMLGISLLILKYRNKHH